MQNIERMVESSQAVMDSPGNEAQGDGISENPTATRDRSPISSLLRRLRGTRTLRQIEAETGNIQCLPVQHRVRGKEAWGQDSLKAGAVLPCFVASPARNSRSALRRERRSARGPHVRTAENIRIRSRRPQNHHLEAG